MTKTIAPMLASPLTKANITDWAEWMMEIKYDGHRLIVEVDGAGVTAYTRERRHAGRAGKTQLTRDLPPHLVREFKQLAHGAYDGELLAMYPDGRVGTSTDVTRTDLQSSLRFVVFDVLRGAAGSTMMLPYEQRRALLARLMSHDDLHSIVLAEARSCVDADTVAEFCHAVWDAGGEGLILKRRDARYEPGKRTLAFIKIKKLFTAVCRVTGFEATRGTVMNRGAFATVTLEVIRPAPEHPQTMGLRTSVKTKDDLELGKFNQAIANREGTLDHVMRTHPALGRELRIEYQDIAADGGLRHPRWDRWEDE